VETGRKGIAYGASAYLMWGLFPLYWPLLEPAGAVEILAHRVVWSLIVVVLLLALRPAARQALPRDRRRLGLLAVAAVVIAVNWGVYIWGVNHKHVVETSLGYFVNPLVTVGLGVLVLGERLRAAQWAGVATAAVGVLVLTAESGRPPWIALVLAFSFATYGLVKKVAGVGAVESLAIETALLGPLALAYLVVLAVTGHGTFTTGGVGHTLLLAGAGPVTAIPLLAFGAAARLVPLSTLGLLQYLTPTMQFLFGVLFYSEPMPLSRLAGFALVWLALAMFTAETWRHRRRLQLQLAAEAIG
jgi:chloramphenicol-sensitive protein RarD